MIINFRGKILNEKEDNPSLKMRNKNIYLGLFWCEIDFNEPFGFIRAQLQSVLK